VRSNAWLCALATAALLAGTGTRVLARDHGHGNGDDDNGWHGDHGNHGNHYGHGDHGDHYDHGDRGWHGRDWGRDDGHGRYYRGYDEDAIRHWYRERYDDDRLPPGLARRDDLPPGLERQLVIRGTLPPGLRRRIEPCPPDLVRVLPPPPPHCEHVFIGGHLVLLNRENFQIVDIFHFEL
jgi:hypothetical protein